MTTELALRPEDQAVHGLELAERVFTQERREAIAKFLNVTADEPALLPYLAVCASWGLDPIMGQVWLIPTRMKVRDGDAESYQDRYRVAIGRDGLLAIARRQQRWRGLKGTTVCEHDSFEVVYDGSDDEPKVLHRFASKPTQFEEGEAPDRWRGRVLGAWAKSFVVGQPPMFYFAPIREHMKLEEVWTGPRGNRHQVLNQDGTPKLQPAGAWGYTSTMAQKSAQSYVLRISLGVTGVVPIDELAGGAQSLVEGVAEEIPVEAEFDWRELNGAPETIARLMIAVQAIEELAPMTWPPAKLELVLTGMSDSELLAQAERIEREAELLARRAERPAAPAEFESDPMVEAEPSVASEELSEPESVPDVEVVDEHEEALRFQLGALEDRIRDTPEGTDEFAELSAEIDAVNVELEAMANPDQERLI